MDLTADVIRQRARYYRTLVVTVVAFSIASLIAAVVLQSWRALALLPFVVPFCASFFFVDAWLMARWRRRVLGLWARGTVDLVAFRGMMSADSPLPRQTMGSMVQTLPLAALDSEPGGNRQWLALTAAGIDAHQTYSMAAAAAGLAAGASAIATAIIVRSVMPLIALALAPLAVVVSRLFAAWTLRRSIPRTAQLRHEGIDPHAFASAAALLHWRSIPPKERDRVLSVLNGTRP